MRARLGGDWFVAIAGVQSAYASHQTRMSATSHPYGRCTKPASALVESSIKNLLAGTGGRQNVPSVPAYPHAYWVGWGYWGCARAHWGDNFCWYYRRSEATSVSPNPH